MHHQYHKCLLAGLALLMFALQQPIGAQMQFHDLATRMAGLLGMRQRSEKLLLPNRDNATAPDPTKLPEELIKKENYPYETHEVTTEDGYILTVHRIPGPANSTAFYIQHGLLESSADWLVAGRNKSFPYILADHGYDVWVGNARGNTYSKKHKKLSPTDQKYWDFSWHELGAYDLPAVISYIWDLKRDSLFYVGHSMGATTFSVMAIERPEIAEKVKAAFLLAPATYVNRMRAPIKMIAPFWKKIQRFTNSIGMHELLPRSPFFDAFAKHICGSYMFRNVVCGNSLFLIAGFNPDQLNYSLLQKIWTAFPAGTSMKLFIHWLQQIATESFRSFDHGYEGNLKTYNASEPPKFDLSKVQVPIAILWSENDLLVGERDVRHFYNEIPNKLGIHKIKHSKFNHFDFLWGVNAPELVYSKILDLMSLFNNEIIKK